MAAIDDKNREVLAELERSAKSLQYAIALAETVGLTTTDMKLVLADLEAEIEVQRAAIIAA